MRSPSGVYLLLRQLVDGDLADGPGQRPGANSLLVLLLLAAGPVALSGERPVGWMIGISLGAAWLSFAGWRDYRMVKAGFRRGDRHYDRVTRFILGAENRQSESATAKRRAQGGK